MPLIWESYIFPSLGNASGEQIDFIESLIGVKLPEDYRRFIVDNQGKYPSKETVVSGELSSSTFGPIFHIVNESTIEQKLYSVIENWKKWSEVYGRVLPIADSTGIGCFFAYDYREADSDPSIIFIDIEEDPSDEDAILFVSKSLTELIDCLS